MTPSLEGWPTKAKEAPSPHEVRLAPLDTNPVFQSLVVKHDLFILGYFLPFYLPNSPENQNLKKIKKTPRDIINILSNIFFKAINNVLYV